MSQDPIERINKRISKLKQEREDIKQQRRDGTPLYSQGFPDTGSVLTNTQRKYLLGEIQQSGAQERTTRARIRERTAAAVLDLILVGQEMAVKDRKKVSQELTDLEFETAIQSLEMLQNTNPREGGDAQ
jgi:hypothetical protein